MPLNARGPRAVSLAGPPASRLARHLLDAAPEGGLEAVWEELARHAGRAPRVAHDWDPATGRLTLTAR